MHEIITLQLGQLSNYVATHFWNTQESYFTYDDGQESPVNHDVHFRPGIGADGTETFMPRTVIYDLKGGYGSMKKTNALYEIEDQSVHQGPWSGPTVVHKQVPIEAGAYQKSLDSGDQPPELSSSTVRYWSDFNRVFFHPRSVIQLNEYELNSTLMPFDKWAMGEELFASLDKEHDIVDRDLRPFIEEADQMQGIQILTGLDDAWGGFAAKYLETLRDEYGKTALWVWGIQEAMTGTPREKRLLRLANRARALTDIYAQASLVMPLNLPSSKLPPNVAISPSSMWHTSALFATALESTTLYTRLKASGDTKVDTLAGVADSLNVFGKQTIARLQLSVVDPRSSDAADGTRSRNISQQEDLCTPGDRSGYESEMDSRKECFDLDMDLSPVESFTPSTSSMLRRSKKAFCQIVTNRGMSQEGIHREPQTTRNQGWIAGKRQKLDHFNTKLAFPLLDSFPRIYRDDGMKPLTEAAAIRTVLSTDSSMSDSLKGLRITVSRSIGVEDRENLTNDLAEMADAYKEGWSSGDDDDDDD